MVSRNQRTGLKFSCPGKQVNGTLKFKSRNKNASFNKKGEIGSTVTPVDREKP